MSDEVVAGDHIDKRQCARTIMPIMWCHIDPTFGPDLWRSKSTCEKRGHKKRKWNPKISVQRGRVREKQVSERKDIEIDRESKNHHKVLTRREEEMAIRVEWKKKLMMKIVVRASPVYPCKGQCNTACSASETWDIHACRGHEEQRLEPIHRGLLSDVG